MKVVKQNRNTLAVFFPAIPAFTMGQYPHAEYELTVLETTSLEGRGKLQSEQLRTIHSINLTNKAVDLLFSAISVITSAPRPETTDHEKRIENIKKLYELMEESMDSFGYDPNLHKVIAIADPMITIHMELVEKEGFEFVPETHILARDQIVYTFVDKKHENVFPYNDALGNLIIGDLMSAPGEAPDIVKYTRQYAFVTNEHVPIYCLKFPPA